jgi:hypothetical protein
MAVNFNYRLSSHSHSLCISSRPFINFVIFNIGDDKGQHDKHHLISKSVLRGFELNNPGNYQKLKFAVSVVLFIDCLKFLKMYPLRCLFSI